MTVRPFFVYAGVAAAIITLGLWYLQPALSKTETEIRRVYDEAGIIPRDNVPRFEGYLRWIFEESDVDVRLVFLRDLAGASLEDAAVEWVERLRIGAQGREERGVLLLYDLASQRLRVELGYGLEEYLPDAFIGYLMNDHACIFFKSGDVSTGLRLMLRILHARIRLAILGERFDPRALTVIRQPGPLSGGAGASATMAPGQDPAGYFWSAIETEARGRFVAQDSPEQTYLRYLKWLAMGQFDPDIPLFTPDTRQYIRGFPMSKAYFDYILLKEYGRLFKTDIRGDLALLYFTNDPFVPPHFFRRLDNHWYMDIVAEVRNTVNRTGGMYTWDYRGHARPDDFTKTFSDKFVNIGGYIRLVDGDKRQLPTRGSALHSLDTARWTRLHFAAAQVRVEEVKVGHPHFRHLAGTGFSLEASGESADRSSRWCPLPRRDRGARLAPMPGIA